MKKLIFVIAVALTIGATTAFTLNQQVSKPEYIYLNQKGTFIHISGTSVEFESLNVKKEMVNNAHDFSPLLKRVSDYESQGWEVVNTDFASTTNFYYLNFILKK